MPWATADEPGGRGSRRRRAAQRAQTVLSSGNTCANDTRVPVDVLTYIAPPNTTSWFWVRSAVMWWKTRPTRPAFLGKMRGNSPAGAAIHGPAPAQLRFARQRPGTAAVRFLEGDAQALPLPDASVDAAVMALVLFFLPDPPRGLRELERVVRDGGTIAAYHWDMVGGGFPLQPVLDALCAEGHEAWEPPSTWAASLGASKGLWRSAGLAQVQTCQFEVCRSFGSFEDFWRTADGSPRLRALIASLSPAALQRVSDLVRERFGVAQGEPVVLKARANAVKGQKP